MRQAALLLAGGVWLAAAPAWAAESTAEPAPAPPGEPAAPPSAPPDGAPSDAARGADGEPAAAPAPAAGTPEESAPRPPPPPAAPASPPAAAEAPAPAARDTVGGHVAVGALAGYAAPFGSVSSATTASDLVGPGLQLGADVTYGVSRTVVLGLYGQFATLAGRGAWSAQDATSLAAGPMVRYHLVQGTRFDPWIALGVGLRRISAGSDSLTGLDFTRLQLGGDWYATSQLGFGPVLELALGTLLDGPATLGTGGVMGHFVLSARVVFDAPGK